MRMIGKVLITALGIWVAVQLVPGLTFEGDWIVFALVALLLSVLNVVVKPVLKFFSIPIIIFTLGLFLIVLNALMLQLTVWLSAPERLDLGLMSEGFFWSTILGAIVISIVQFLVNLFVDND